MSKLVYFKPPVNYYPKGWEEGKYHSVFGCMTHGIASYKNCSKCVECHSRHRVGCIMQAMLDLPLKERKEFIKGFITPKYPIISKLIEYELPRI